MLGQETKQKFPLYEAERPPTPKELALWDKADKAARRTTLKAHRMRLLYQNIVQIHKFAAARKVSLNEPDLPGLEARMLIALKEIETLKDYTCSVNQLELGVRLSEGGEDLDIIQPEPASLGWILPAAIGVVLVIGIIARWAFLEREVDEVSTEYNGIMKRADMALCADPGSQMCADWKHDKATGGYFKRETIIESVKNAVEKIGSGAKTGLGWGLALAVPLLLFMYLPRRKDS